jgi:hypothetical protein
VLVEPVTVPLLMPDETREAYLEVRLRQTGEVVTIIERLSPANKRAGSDGHREYRQKHDLVLRSSAHLVELDLLRGGERVPMGAPLPPPDYYAIVSRASRRPFADVWRWRLADPMPPVRIPLAGKDPDVALDLQAVFSAAYERAGYDYALDYEREIAPPVSAEVAAWARSVLAARAPAAPS